MRNKESKSQQNRPPQNQETKKIDQNIPKYGQIKKEPVEAKK